MVRLIISGVIVLFIVLMFCFGYVKAPTNAAYIISGFKKEPRVLIGRAGVRIRIYKYIKKYKISKTKQVTTNSYIYTMLDYGLGHQDIPLPKLSYITWQVMLGWSSDISKWRNILLFIHMTFLQDKIKRMSHPTYFIRFGL